MFGPNSIGSMSIPTLFRQGGTSSGSSVENRFAISLDGVDQTVRFFGSPAPSTAFTDVNTDNQFTLNFWVRSSDISAVVELTAMGSASTYNRMFLTGSGGTLNYWGVSSSGIAFAVSASVTLSDDTWHMITAVGTRSTNWSVTLYLDGQALTTSGIQQSHDMHNGGSMFIGKALGSATYYEIDVDEMSLFKTALSAANVLYMYNNIFDLNTWTEATGKLMWWYRLENNTEDSASNYADGIELNDPTYLSASTETLPYNS